MPANQIVRRHNNAVYDRVAVSNVATQIEQLFWYSSEPDDLLGGERHESDGVLRVGDDVAEPEYEFPSNPSPPSMLIKNHRNIEMITTTIDEEEQTTQFTRAMSRLQALNDRRQAARRKLEQYKQLQKMLEPLKSPPKSVQPNLVTRDGPLADELARSKALGIRVAGGVARRKERCVDAGMDGDDDIVMVDEGQKLAGILGKQ